MAKHPELFIVSHDCEDLRRHAEFRPPEVAGMMLDYALPVGVMLVDDQGHVWRYEGTSYLVGHDVILHAVEGTKDAKLVPFSK